MPSSKVVVVYDTRFFVEHFYSKDENIVSKTRAEIDARQWDKLVSVITLHEFYRLNLEKAGRDVAKLRNQMIEDVFNPVDVTKEIAIAAAILRKRYGAPMSDGLIAATAQVLDGTCVTDDPHIREMKEIGSRWLD